MRISVTYNFRQIQTAYIPFKALHYPENFLEKIILSKLNYSLISRA